MTRRLDPRHIWNVISNARSNKCHPPNSPNTASAAQNDHPTSGGNLRKTAETSFPMRGRSEHDPTMIRAWSETVPVSPQPATQQRLLFALRTSILYWKMQHFELILSFQISPSTAPTTKSDPWTSPSTAPTTKSDTWTSPRTAPTTKSDPWTSPSTAPATTSDTWTSPTTAPTTKSNTWPSPSTAPATQNDSQAWSSSHMKRHFQCEEQQIKCHPPNSPNTASATQNDHQKSGVLRLPLQVTLELHQVLRLPRQVTLELHQLLRLARKVTLELHQVLRLLLSLLSDSINWLYYTQTFY